jgi:hypothetical protein
MNESILNHPSAGDARREPYTDLLAHLATEIGQTGTQFWRSTS